MPSKFTNEKFFKKKDDSPVIIKKQLNGDNSGEGWIHDVDIDQRLCAKMYKGYGEPVSQRGAYTPEKIKKILDMSQMSFSNPYITWPDADSILVDKNGVFVGYLMPKIDMTEYKESQEIFKDLNVKFQKDYKSSSNKNYIIYEYVAVLLKICKEVSNRIQFLHQHHILFADIKFENFLVSKKTYHAFLIDTDSYQVPPNHITALFSEGYIAPEILLTYPNPGDFFSKNPRTDQHELFALAVLFFGILMHGASPFSIISSSGNKNDSIKNNVFKLPDDDDKNKVRSYFHNKISPEQNLVIIIWPLIGTKLRQLFIKAFDKSNLNNLKRPTASEWELAFADSISDIESKKNLAATQIQPQAPVQPQVPVQPQPATSQQVVSSTNKKNNYLLYAIYVLIGITIIVVIFWDSLFASGDITKSNNVSTNESVITSPAPSEAISAPTPVPPAPVVVSDPVEPPINNTTVSKPKKVVKPKPKSNSTTQQAPSQSSGYSSQTGDM
ncbi:MAG: hypothetical protein EKK57_02450 [Proteobacteria bacterium]|nr:MAG: hypothetical protein EKK57_02450 [Pseudomonadota bacterium]